MLQTALFHNAYRALISTMALPPCGESLSETSGGNSKQKQMIISYRKNAHLYVMVTSVVTSPHARTHAPSVTSVGVIKR